ncbi:unnamed protein product [Didymodactylos carnosus]|uniref:Uncharacterized protein n=1 Tax=Didymodactylos carnosus TaxID=1234261 RepID=A0A814JNI3_9BILA|nr:unnamed protein product [Didymodactylos carnosus]CAF1564532.1 unnamed protein product [Didymodactylos carnosus]CAF3811829.1 unnamed protein product [Didymodactylos carnosus]CAF4357334.1 unnamed protein product [Didymodactylos carnosus]
MDEEDAKYRSEHEKSSHKISATTKNQYCKHVLEQNDFLVKSICDQNASTIKILQTTLKTNDLTPPPAGSLNNLLSDGRSSNDTINLRPTTNHCQSTVSLSQPATQKRIIKLTVFGDSTITHLNASHIHVPCRSAVQLRSGCPNFDHLSSQVLHDKLKTDITSRSLVVVGTNNLSSSDTVDTTIDKLKLFVSIFKEKYNGKSSSLLPSHYVDISV